MIKKEHEIAQQKRDELRNELNSLESKKPRSHYNIMITRDRLAYWEGKAEGLKFALDQLKSQEGSTSL